jgi:hypothetical protein
VTCFISHPTTRTSNPNQVLFRLSFNSQPVTQLTARSLRRAPSPRLVASLLRASVRSHKLFRRNRPTNHDGDVVSGTSIERILQQLFADFLRRRHSAQSFGDARVGDVLGETVRAKEMDGRP